MNKSYSSSARWTLLLAIALIFGAFGATRLQAQAADGNLVGNVVDMTGAAVPGASVEIVNLQTNVRTTTVTGGDGSYRLGNLLVGQYDLRISHEGFSAVKIGRVSLVLNTTVTANATLQVGANSTVVEVKEAASPIDTTTAQVASVFGGLEALEIPSSSLPLGTLNFSLLSAGVASSGGIGTGEGPSVGGQRPRANNFMIEGVDNNRKDTTGRIVAVPEEAALETTVIQNQALAEFGGGSGGQFNTVLRNGGNKIHGSLYEFLQNRNLNALDQAFVRSGTLDKPRYDQNRMGGSMGGAIIKNKLFYYGLFEYNPLGNSSTPAPVSAPTAAGYSLLSSIPGLSASNLGILQKYLPAAAADGTSTPVFNRVTGQNVSIPLGVLPIVGPSYTNAYNWLVNIDYNISNSDQLRVRGINNLSSGYSAETLPALPAFYQGRTENARLYSLSEFHTFSPSVLNEFRFGYNRYNNSIPAGDYKFPGLDAFPNLYFQDLNAQLGPFASSPSGSVLNTYQLINNLSWNRGRHAFKFGWEGRKYISTQIFTQATRGDYEYSGIDLYLRDFTPDQTAQRTVGGGPYSGNAIHQSFYLQDQYRIRPNFTLSAGARYEYHGVSAGDKLQELNAIANVPGLITFNAPQAYTNAWAPRLGLAYSPGKSASTTIRAGFGLSYDKGFDNLGLNGKPAQVVTNIDITGDNNPNFLANGGILQRPGYTVFTTASEARANTSTHLPNQYLLPYASSWNVGVTHVFHQDYTLEVRYLGTRSVHLPVQTQLNVTPRVTASNYIPTFLTAPNPAALVALPSLAQVSAPSRFLPQFAPYFPNNLTEFGYRGNSKYNGLAVELGRRFARGVLMKTAYTWSHATDDSTADVNSTALSPRRPQDSQNIAAEWSNSFLDRRHRFTQTMVYETPWFKGSRNLLLKSVAANFILSGTYTYESPQFATVQSGVDSNLNGDTASDRSIINLNGVPNTGSGVNGIDRGGNPTSDPAAIVAYVAQNPNAQYIVAGKGSLANGGRQTLATRPINDVNFSIKKAFELGEGGGKFEFGAQLFNAFNHPQYTPGSVNDVAAHGTPGNRINLIPGNAAFNRPDLVYGSNPRVIQLVGRFQF